MGLDARLGVWALPQGPWGLVIWVMCGLVISDGRVFERQGEQGLGLVASIQLELLGVVSGSGYSTSGAFLCPICISLDSVMAGGVLGGGMWPLGELGN